MDRQLNSFALLGDDEGEDVSALLARAEAAAAAAAKVEVPFPTDKKQAKNDKDPADNGRKSERGRGRGGGRGRGMRSSAAGGNEAEQYGSGGSDFYQAGTDISQREYAGNNGHPRSNGGDSSWRVTDPNSQGWGNGRGRGRGQSRGGGRGRGADRKRGYRESQGFGNEKQEPENENQGLVSNIIVETAGQDDGEDGGWQQVSISRGKSDRYTRNSERSWGGSERRGYSGGNRGYRAREGRSYGDNDGSNNENVGDGSNCENSVVHGGTDYENSGWNVTNYEDGNFNGRNYEHHGTPHDSEPKEQINSDTVLNNGDENAADTEWNDPVPTETLKEPEIEQGKLEDVVKEDDAEKKKEEEEENQMTLEEYEKLRLEKRKSLESFKTKERKVTLDKDFESMQLIEKNREEGLFVKLKSDKDKLKKKDSYDKEEKIRKVVSINEFLKPAEGSGDYTRRGGRGRGRGGGRGRGPGGFRGGREGNSTPHIEDPGQFPVLQAVVKA